MIQTPRRVLGVLVLALASEGGVCTGEEDPRADFVFVNWSDPKTLDPQLMTGSVEGRLAEAIFEGLTYRDAKTLNPMPGQAASWVVSDDGRTWTFHMRKEARWSNGERVTARDFVTAWVRLVDPALAAEYAHLLYPVRHAEAYSAYTTDLRTLHGDPASPDAPAREGLIRGFAALADRSPEGVPASAWQKLLDECAARDSLSRAKDLVLRSALGKRDGALSPEAGKFLRSALGAASAEWAAALAEAKAHFGKDEGVFARDDDTLVVELRSFTPYFLELTSFWPTYPVHGKTVERMPDRWSMSPETAVTNGPFRLASWTRKDKIRLRKNPDYWGAKDVALETVDALALEDLGATLDRFKKGEVDWAPSGYPPERQDEARALPGYYQNTGMIVYFLRFNCTKPPLDDPRVRRAIGLAIDRPAITGGALGVRGVPATTFVPPGLPGYAPPESGLGLDVATARRLLAEAGFPEGKGFPMLTFLFNTNVGHKRIAEKVASDLRANLGIRMEPVSVEWQSFLERVSGINYDVARGGWIGDFRDPTTFLDMWATGGANNQTGWGSPRYDRLLQLAADPMAAGSLVAEDRTRLLGELRERAAARTLLDAVSSATQAPERIAAAAALRLHFLREAEAILMQEAFPVIPIYDYIVSGLVSPKVTGFYTEVPSGVGAMGPNPEDLHPLRGIGIRRDGR